MMTDVRKEEEQSCEAVIRGGRGGFMCTLLIIIGGDIFIIFIVDRVRARGSRAHYRKFR